MSITNIISNGEITLVQGVKRTLPLRGIVGYAKHKIRSAQRSFEQRD